MKKVYTRYAFNMSYGGLTFHFGREPDPADVEAAWTRWLEGTPATPGLTKLRDELLTRKSHWLELQPVARAATREEVAATAYELLAQLKGLMTADPEVDGLKQMLSAAGHITRTLNPNGVLDGV